MLTLRLVCVHAPHAGAATFQSSPRDARSSLEEGSASWKRSDGGPHHTRARHFAKQLVTYGASLRVHEGLRGPG